LTTICACTGCSFSAVEFAFSKNQLRFIVMTRVVHKVEQSTATEAAFSSQVIISLLLSCRVNRSGWLDAE